MGSDEDWILAHREFIRASNHKGTPRMLDLGCGRGRDAYFLRDLGSVVAADLNHERLTRCRSSAPGVHTVCLNLADPLPFANNTFNFVLASLSLHYFSWVTTQSIMTELGRCLTSQGHCIVRVNSTNDVNYGADSTQVIERNYFHVGNQKKRFFDSQDIQSLFKGWQTLSVREMTINRYAKYKSIWEVVLRANQDSNKRSF